MSDKQPPMFSILYLDKAGNEIKSTTPVEDVFSVSVTISVPSLVENQGLGTALLKGFMQERTEEFTRLIQTVRLKKREKSKILTPGVNQHGFTVLK